MLILPNSAEHSSSIPSTLQSALDEIHITHTASWRFQLAADVHLGSIAYASRSETELQLPGRDRHRLCAHRPVKSISISIGASYADSLDTPYYSASIVRFEFPSRIPGTICLLFPC